MTSGQYRRQQTSSVKGRRATISDFVSHGSLPQTFSVCCCSAKAATADRSRNRGGWTRPLRSPVNAEGGWNRPVGCVCQLLSSGLSGLAGRGDGNVIRHPEEGLTRQESEESWEACNGEPPATKNRTSLQATALECSWFKEDWILLSPVEKKSRAWESRADTAAPRCRHRPRRLRAAFSTVLARMQATL